MFKLIFISVNLGISSRNAMPAYIFPIGSFFQKTTTNNGYSGILRGSEKMILEKTRQDKTSTSIQRYIIESVDLNLYLFLARKKKGILVKSECFLRGVLLVFILESATRVKT